MRTFDLAPPKFFPLQRIGPLAQLPSLLKEFGVNPSELFRDLPVHLDDLSNPEGHLPFDDCVRMLARAAELTRCPHIGLVLGSRVDARALGVAGEVLLVAPILREALIDFIGLQSGNSAGAVVYLLPHGTDYLLGYGVYQFNGGISRYAYDLSLAVAYATVKSATGGAAVPLEVLVCHKHADRRPYEMLFKAPVQFNQNQAGLVYPTSAMEAPVVTADPRARRRLQELVAQRFPVDQPLTQRTRHLLRPLLLLKRGTMNDIADALRVNDRTLRRKLFEEGTTFQIVRDEVRLAVAMELLHLTEMPVTEIADALAFAHPSTFTRAFRRWSGQSPTEVRVDASHER